MPRIEWREWNPFHFDKAKHENKPILLSISANWCHWCHRMDSDTYAKDTIAEFVHKHFIPIRIDTDQRPDINARYNAGGWPTAVVMDGNGIPLNYTLYLPEKPFFEFLYTSLEAFQELKVPSPMARPLLSEEPRQRTSTTAPVLTHDEYAGVETHFLALIKNQFDAQFGGFGNGQKFPHIEVLRFLVSRAEHFRDPEPDTVILKTLDAIQSRGLCDKEEHGFFRYCTTREWSIPHFEKMLEDNAQLIEIFARAARIYDRADFRQTAENTFSFLEKRFKDPKTKLFFGSQNSDEHYYLLPASERAREKIPKMDSEIFSDWNASAICSLAALNRPLDAQTQMNTLLEKTFSEKGIRHSLSEGNQQLLLKDHAWVLRALLMCAQFNESEFMHTAEKLSEFTIEKFWNGEKKAFMDTHASAQAVGLLLEPLFPIAENALMIENLLALFKKLNQAKFENYARNAFATFFPDYLHYGIFAVPYAEAAFQFKQLDSKRANPKTE